MAPRSSRRAGPTPKPKSYLDHAGPALNITGATQFTRPAHGALRMNKFVQRLHAAIIGEASRGTITWRSGTLILHSTSFIASEILPKYFKMSNFKTFRRQLNYYGFIHAKSYVSPSGVGTTALWVNQELANSKWNNVDSILLLKRVDASDNAKTRNGRKMRKEGAIGAIDGDGDCASSGDDQSCSPSLPAAAVGTGKEGFYGSAVLHEFGGDGEQGANNAEGVAILQPQIGSLFDAWQFQGTPGFSPISTNKNSVDRCSTPETLAVRVLIDMSSEQTDNCAR